MVKFGHSSLVLVISLLLGLLQGCDGSLAVSGVVGAEQCELSLWSERGPIWSDAVPKKLRASIVGGEFAAQWTISGPAGEHWLEISCPGYETWRSPPFEAPSSDPEMRLGHVSLKKQQ